MSLSINDVSLCRHNLHFILIIPNRRLPPSPHTPDTLNQCPNLLARPLSNVGVKVSSLKPSSTAFYSGKKSCQKIVDKTRTSSSSNLHTLRPNEPPPHPQTKRTIIKRVGDRVGRYLALGDGFLLQKKAIETENPDYFLRLGLRLALALSGRIEKDNKQQHNNQTAEGNALGGVRMDRDYVHDP